MACFRCRRSLRADNALGKVNIPASPLSLSSVALARKDFVLLSQHIGAPAVAVVKQKDPVILGQRIAQAAEGLSVSIHAPIQGTVTEVTDKYIMIEA